MNEEFLLQAIGHIDEELIAEAEEYRPAERPSLRRPLAGLAACAAVVLALYWGADNLRMGSANSASGSAANSAQTTDPSSSVGGGETQENETWYESTDNSGDWCPAIMVDGQLYWSSGEILSPVDESAILGTTTYTDDLPDQDGQANFNREGTLYARTAEGIAVEIDGQWVLFTPNEP